MADQTNPLAAFADLTLSFLEETLGVIFIGYVFAAVGFGFTFFQSYYYYTRYSRDHWLIKATVVALCALDTAMTCLVSETLYYYLVTLFTQPVGPAQATTTFCIEVLLAGISSAIVQCFYGFRVWQVSRSAIFPAAIIGVAIASGGLGIAASVVMLHNPTFANFSRHYMMVVIGTGQGLRMLAGGMASLGMVAHGATPAGSKDIESSVYWDPLTTFLATGIAAALAQLLCFVTFISMPPKYLWIIFHFLSSRAAINGLLLMLNCRAISHGRGIYEEETRVNRSGVLTTNSEVMFNRNGSHTLNVEVSRVVNTDAVKDKDDDLNSMHSGPLRPSKIDVNAY